MEKSEAKEASELVTRIRSGDAAAEAELVVRYGPNVMRMLRALERNRWCAEDVHQETFATALQRLRCSGIDEPAALAHFLRQTARFLLIARWLFRARRNFRDVLERQEKRGSYGRQ